MDAQYLFDITLNKLDKLDKESKDFRNNTIEKLLESYETQKNIAPSGYARIEFTSSLVNRFINSINLKWNIESPFHSKIELGDKEYQEVNALKYFNYKYTILSARLKVAESRGTEIVNTIFNEIKKSEGQYLPEDYRKYYVLFKNNNPDRVICDFVAGMTDRYAIEFYARLKSENPQTIFKPI